MQSAYEDHEVSDVGNSARKGFAWTGIAQITKQILDFSVGILIARLLDPSDFGVVSASMIVLSFISIFTSFGFSTVIIQRATINTEFIRTAQTLIVAMGVISTITLCMSAHWIGLFYNNPTVAEVIPVMSLIFIITSFNMVPSALLTRNIQFNKTTIISVIGSVTYAITSASMALGGYGVWSIIIGPLISSMVGTLLLFFAASYFPRFGFNRIYIKELFSFGGFVTISSLLNHLARNADNLIIGRYLGAELLGLYARAYNLATIPKEILVSVFGSVLFPSFARLQHDLSRVKSAYLKSINTITLASLPVSVILLILTPEFINTVYGSKWSGAIVPLRILSLAGFVYSLYVPCSSLLLGLGKMRMYSILQVAYSSALISLVMISYRYGINYVAGAVSFVIVIVFVIYLYGVNTLIKISLIDYYDSMKVAVKATLLMIICLLIEKAILPTISNTINEYVVFALEITTCFITYTIYILRSKDEIVSELILMVKNKIS